MSKFAAIDVAVRMQLASDGKTIDYGLTLGALTPAPYDNQVSLRAFLLNVANRLKLDNPPLTFHWNEMDTASCLNVDIPMLIALIENTTDREPQTQLTARQALTAGLRA